MALPVAVVAGPRGEYDAHSRVRPCPVPSLLVLVYNGFVRCGCSLVRAAVWCIRGTGICPARFSAARMFSMSRVSYASRGDYVCAAVWRIRGTRICPARPLLICARRYVLECLGPFSLELHGEVLHVHTPCVRETSDVEVSGTGVPARFLTNFR